MARLSKANNAINAKGVEFDFYITILIGHIYLA